MTSLSKSTLPEARLPRGARRPSELRAQDRDADPEDDQGKADYDIPSTLEALNDDELYELSQHEVVIQRGLKTFVEVGEALMAIREGRLYRQTYYTFEEYCQQRWQLGRNYVNKVILAANVVENLGTNVPILPTNESQVRPLTKLETPEEQQAAWQKAVETAPGGKVTGAHVATVVDEMKSRPPVVEPPVVEAEGDEEEPALRMRVMHGFRLDEGILYDTGHFHGKNKLPRVYGVVIGFTAHRVKIRFYDRGYKTEVERAVLPEKLIPSYTPPGESPLRRMDVEDVPDDDAVDDYVPEVEAVEIEAAAEEIEVVQVESDALRVGATVRMASNQTGTIAAVNGRLITVDTPNGPRVYDGVNVTVVEAEPAGDEAEAPIQPPNYKLETKRTFPANETVSQPFDFCQTPPYALEPLLPYLGWSMPSTIWEPAKGEGLLVQALYDGGWRPEHVVTSDILTGQNFFEYEPEQWDIIVTNPPYSLKFRWLERCYQLDKPFALLLPVEALGAVTAQELMQRYGFEMMLLDTRVNFKMPNKGWDGSSPFPTFWLTWHLLPEKVMFGSISEGKRAFNERL